MNEGERQAAARGWRGFFDVARFECLEVSPDDRSSAARNCHCGGFLPVPAGAYRASLRQVDELGPVGIVDGDHTGRVEPPVQMEVAAVESRGDGRGGAEVLELHEDVDPRRLG